MRITTGDTVRARIFRVGVVMMAVGVLADPLFGGEIQNELVAVEDVLLDISQEHKNTEGEVSLPMRSDSAEARALFRFDLSSLQAHAEGEVISATLRLHVEEASGFAQFLESLRAGGAPILAASDVATVHRLTQDWSVTAATWACPADTALQNNKSDCAVPWDGGTFEAATDDRIILDGTDLTFDLEVGADVQAFLEGTPNFGWLVQAPIATSGAGLLRVTSVEGPAAQAPRLLVTFDTDAVAPAVEFVDPAPQTRFLLEDPRPRIEIRFTDGGSGLDLGSVAILLDGADITSQCSVTGDTADTTAVCTPTSDLDEGLHTLLASVLDADGNQTTAGRELDVLLGPGPHTREIVADADATLRSDAPSQNFGTDPTLVVRDAPTARTVLHFDVGAYELLPLLTETVFEDLTLRVFAESAVDLGAGRSLDAARSRDVIFENEVTWDCRFDEDPAVAGISCSLPWNGGTFESPPADTVAVTDATAGWLTWSLPVSSLEEAPSTPFSWFLRFSDDGDTTVSADPPTVTFTSREGIAGQEPRVRVTFRTPLVGDETPPQAVFTAPIGRTLDSTPAVALTFFDDQAGVDTASFGLTVDGADMTANCSVTTAGADCVSPSLIDGVHTFVATLADRAGNSSQTTHTVEIGPGPPDIEILSPAPAVLNDATPQIEAAISDLDGDFDPATVRVLVDGRHITADCVIDATGALCPSPVLEEGTHRLLVIAGDLAGFEASAERIFDVSFDATFPDLAITAPSTRFVLDPRPDVTVTYSGTGVDPATFVLLLDAADITSTCSVGAAQADCEPAASLAEGEHELRASVANASGNIRTAVLVFDVLPGDGAYTRTLTAVADTSIGVASRGSATSVRVSPSPDLPTRTLVRFDTSIFDSLAAEATLELEDIVLRLTVADQQDFDQDGMTLDLFPLDRAWNETEATQQCPVDEDPATGGSQCATPWNGGSFGAQVASDPVLLGEATAVFDLGVAGFNVDGWIVRDSEELTNDAPVLPSLFFASREHGVLSAPELVVSFLLSDVPDFEPPSLVILSPAATVVNNDMPDVELFHSDSRSGVDLTTLAVSVDGVDISAECGLAAPDESSCSLPFALAAGLHGVQAQVADVAGNVASAELDFEVIFDALPPTITRVSPPATVFNDTQPAIEVTYSDDDAVDTTTLEVDLDGVDLLASCTVTPTGATCTPPVLAAGPHTLRVFVEDRIGRATEELFDFEIVLDTTAPTLAITAPVGTIFNDTTPAVTVTFSDDTAGVDPATLDVQVDGISIFGSCVVDEVAGTATCEPGELTAGTHTLSASLSDLAGNPATASGSFELVIDTTAPTLAVTAPSGTVVGDSTPAVTVTFSDAVSGVDTATLQVRVDGFDITASCVPGAGTATCEPPALGEGDHTTTAEIADLAGNVATASQPFTVELNLTDTVAPSLAITAPSGSVVDDPAPAITVTYSDAESDVDLTTLRIAVDGFELIADGRCTVGAASTTCTPPLLGAGSHALSADIEDLAGNPATATASFDLSFTAVDTVAPGVAITEPADTTVFDDLTPQITVTYSDADSGVAILTLAVDIDGADITAGCVLGDAASVCEPPPLTVGTHVVTATVEDLHGNQGSASFGFDIALTTPDTTPPTIAIAEPSTTPLDMDVTPIRVTYADGETGVHLSSLVITLDATDITATCDVGPTEATCTSPVLAEGVHALDASIEDLAGNAASASFGFEVVVAQDTDPPEMTVTAPPASVQDDSTPAVILEYLDLESGVDTSTLVIFVDSIELTGCDVQPTAATCEPPPLGTGEHRVHAEIGDLAGNLGVVERLFEIQLELVDETPPTVTLTAPVDPIVVDDSSPEVRIEYSDVDSGVDISSLVVLMDEVAFTSGCVIDSSGAVCEPPDLPQGLHELQVLVNDLAGNLGGAELEFEILLSAPEVDPPILDILSPTGTVQDEPNPEIRLQYFDADSGIALTTLRVQVDGLEVGSACVTDELDASCPSQTLGAGLHTIQAQISDLAGNQTTTQTTFELTFSVQDTVPPSVEIVSPLSNIHESSTRFDVRYSDSETGIDPSSLQLSLDGEVQNQGCSITNTRAVCDIDALSEGPHQFTATVADLQGNAGFASLTLTVDLDADTAPPTVIVISPRDSVLDDLQPEIRIEYLDENSGVDVATLNLSLDGFDLLPNCVVAEEATTCTASPLDAGSHLIEASVQDLAGNEGTTNQLFELIVSPPDVTAPVISITEPSAASVSEEEPLRTLLSYSDGLSGIDIMSLRVLLDGQDVTSTCLRNAVTAACSLGLLGVGSHSLSAEISDLAGNLGTTSRLFEVTEETAPPALRVAAPADDLVVGDATPQILIEYSDAVSGVDTGSLQVTLDGADLLAFCLVDTASTNCEPPPLTPGFHRVSAQIADQRGNLSAASRSFEVSLDLEIAILAPVAGFLTTEGLIDVSGIISPETETVTVHGVTGVISGETFTVSEVELHEGTNTLTAVARTADGGVGAATVGVVRDTTGPRVVIQSPPDGFVTTASQIFVTGEYNEPASSGAQFTEAAVTVNGLPAGVEQRTFVLENHLLQPGENTIRVEATDAAGNVGSAEVTVTLLTNPVQKIEELLGNGQTGTVGQTLPKPFVVRVTDGIGNPLSERLVQFEVTRGDGLVSSAGEQGRSLAVRTDSLGRAQVEFTLGERSGMGNHEVTVTSVGFPGSLVFCASAEPLPAHRVVRVQGNVQTGTLVAAVGEELPKPLYTQVFDEMQNPVAGVPVTYEVVTGAGSFGAQASLTTETDANGVATAIFTLGPLPGVDVHVVKASIPDGFGGPAVFNITGLQPGPEELTSISGVVLDNQDLPVPDVTVSVRDTPLSTLTDAEGRFHIAGAPVGTVHLRADGTTTTLAGTWPVLEFEMVTVSGQDNELGMPIRLLPIDPGVLVGGNADVEIPLAGVPGASLTVFANSVTFPDGSTEGLVSFTQVHNDKVPMVPPVGSIFGVALTIQPPGAHFDPPARIQLPNPGHKPGEVVDLYSFDHDIGEFVSAGTGSVTPDGQFLRSNPGFGVRKAGWHGWAPPLSDTNACNPGSCTFCVLEGPQPNCEECEECTGDGCMIPTLEEVTAVARAGGESSPNLVAPSRIGRVLGPATTEENELIIGVDQEVLLEARNLMGSCAGVLEFEWTFGDASESAMGQAVSHVYDQIGDFLAQVTATCKDCPGSGSASDSVAVKVIDVDLRLHNLPEEDDPPPNELDPGGIVALNHDDDDRDGTLDLMDDSVLGEDEMEVLRLDVDLQLSEGEVTLDLTAGTGKIKVWDDRGKSTEFDLPKKWNLKKEEVPGIVWIEGIERSAAMADVTFLLRYENDQGAMAEDEVNVTVMEVDLDVDSDNTEGFGPPARSSFEDQNEDVEMDPLRPGKYVAVNHDNDDQDDDNNTLDNDAKDFVTDFADGYNRDPALTDDDENHREQFVPLVLELAEPIDVAEAKIRLTYDASDPAGVTVVQVPLDPPTVTVPDYRRPAGHLRLWSVPATGRTSGANLKSGGQFVAPETYTSAELGFGGGRQLTLYVEGLEGSARVGDQRVLVEVDPDGDSGPRNFMLKDAVRFTVVNLEIRDLGQTGDPLIEGGDMAFIEASAPFPGSPLPVPRMPQLAVEILPEDIESQFTCRLEFEFDRAGMLPTSKGPITAGVNCSSGPDRVMLPSVFGVQAVQPGARWHLGGEYHSLYPNSDFFGGDGFITCTSNWGEELKHEFLIRGENPPDTVARSYIDAKHTFRFSYAISKHESKVFPGFPDERYNQFNMHRNRYIGKEHLYAPLAGPPEGWGLFQLDVSEVRRSNPNVCVPSSQLWNWQRNVGGAVSNLNGKVKLSDNWLNAVGPRTDGQDVGLGTRCLTRGGHPYPHGQRPQARIDTYLSSHPHLSIGNVYWVTAPTPCKPTSTGHLSSVLPATVAIMPDPKVVNNCRFTEGPLTTPGHGTFEDADTLQCYNGCSPHYVVWDGASWAFRVHRNYVAQVCQEVEP